MRVHPLLAGEVRMPPGYTERPGGPLAGLRGLGLLTPRSRWYWAPVPAFLVEHPGAGAFLVDTGFAPSVARDPAESFGRLGKLLFGVRMAEEQALGRLVAVRGVAPEAVRLVVMTHLHFDHSSGIGEWPGATFVVSAQEWKAANDQGFTRGYHHHHFHPAFDWHSIDYDAPEISSHESFARSVDLFGDGSVRLAFTPGHTRGHQSVILRLAGGREVVLTGDAAYTLRTISETVLPAMTEDDHLFRRSLSELQHYLALHPEAVVIPGHDPEAWAGLADVYE